MSSIVNRIEQYRIDKNLSTRKIELSMGMSNGAFRKAYESGGDIGSRYIESFLSTYDDVNEIWLLLGKGNMLKTENEKGQKSHTLENQKEKRIGNKMSHSESVTKSVTKSVTYDEGQKRHTLEEGDFQFVSDTDKPQYLSSNSIPFYDINATAGLSPVFNGQNQKPDSYIIMPDAPRCHGAVRVSGDSMYPLIKSGDIVLFKRIEGIPESIIWGEMYLVSLNVDGDEFVTVKLIQPGKGEEYIKLVSYNEFYQPKEIHLSTILGIAHIKAFIHYNTMK